jgi:hypothetical protein
MLTNLTNIHGKAARAAWQPTMGLSTTAMSAMCLRSLPTYTIVGGRVQRHGQNPENLKFSDSRQNQF